MPEFFWRFAGDRRDAGALRPCPSYRHHRMRQSRICCAARHSPPLTGRIPSEVQRSEGSGSEATGYRESLRWQLVPVNVVMVAVV
jgi:hypothetical protein